MPETSTPHFDTIKIIYNPTQEDAERSAEHCVDRLRGWLPDFVTVDTLPSVGGGGRANAKMLSQEVDPGTAIAVRAGDGTFNDIVGATQEPEMAELLPGISITSMNQGGNACDIGTSLHGFFTKDPRKIFSSKLQAVQAFALQCTIEELNGDISVHYAASYMGLGKSAAAAGWIDREDYRKAPAILRDADIVGRTLLSGHRFQLLAHDIHYEFSDLTYWKGGHMAKLGRTAMHVWDPAYRVTPVAGDQLSGVYATAALPFGMAAGFNTSETSRFTTASEVIMHFDGDKPIVVPDYSNITIGFAPRSYTALTTRLS